MRVFCAALIIASMAGPAYAQQQDDHVPRYGEKAKEKSAGEIRQEKDAAKAYQESLKNIPDQGPVDPWGNARSVGAPKTDAKTDAKAAAKTTAKPATKSAAKAAPKATKTGDTSSQ
jgi:hypothetical protein